VASEKVTALKERLYRDQVNGDVFFRAIVSDRLESGAYVLDLGCGKGGKETEFRSEAALVVGCDISQTISMNSSVSTVVRGDANMLPFRSASFDVVVMDYVIEHLESPTRCAQETFRVLKSGGYLCLRTPNLYHYVSLVSYMTPHWFHRLVANRVRGISGPIEADVIKTYYRANTRHSVELVFTQAGFVPEQILMVEREPSYLMFSRPAFLIGYCYERLVNRYECLEHFRSNIFAVMRKPVLNRETTV